MKKTDLNPIEYYTLTVKNNVTNDLYLDWDSLLSFNINKRVAILGSRFKNINEDSAYGFAKKGIIKCYPDLDVSNLEIELVYAPHDIKELPIFDDKVSFRKMYRKSYNNKKQIKVLQEQIKRLESELEEKEEEKTTIQNDIYIIEEEVEDIKEQINKLKIIEEESK